MGAHKEADVIADEISQSEAVSLTQAAQLTGVSRVTVRRYLDAGRFPNAFQVAAGRGRGEWRVPLEDLRSVGWETATPETPRSHADEVTFLRTTVADLTAALTRQQEITADLARALAALGTSPTK